MDRLQYSQAEHRVLLSELRFYSVSLVFFPELDHVPWLLLSSAENRQKKVTSLEEPKKSLFSFIVSRKIWNSFGRNQFDKKFLEMLSDLPELVLDVICVHLSYEDILALRATCKALKQFVDGKKFTRLNLFVRKYPFHHRLFYTNEPICYSHSLHSDDSSIFSSIRFREQFANVQRMVICTKRSWTELRGSDATAFDLNPLNFFRAINHLEVVGFTSISGKLNLQELQIASFQIGYGNTQLESSIELDCPRLRALRMYRCWPVLTNETTQLEYLRYSPYDQPSNYLLRISPNLRKVSTICIELAEKTLQLLSDLKTGRLSLPSLDRVLLELSLECTALGRLDALASCLEDLQRDGQREHIEFTFCGHLIRSPDELRQIARLAGAYNAETGDQYRLSTRILNDHSLRFLSGKPELDLLLSDASSVYLHEDVEWSEEVVKRLKGIKHLEFGSQFQPSPATFEMFARICQSLCGWMLYNQTVTERLLEMLSKHLLNLERIQIHWCRYETLKPLAKFRNLERVGVDFEPPKDELTFLFENSRTLEMVEIFGKDIVDLMRTTTGPKVHQIKIGLFENVKIIKFDSLSMMIDHFYENVLFEISEARRTSTRLNKNNKNNNCSLI